MKDRSKSAHRILAVQKQLHRIEELKLAQFQKRVAMLENEQADLMGALSEDDALQGLFIDMTVRRLTASRLQVSQLEPELEAASKSVLEHAGRVRNAERLADELDEELRRAAERQDLEDILEISLTSEDASLKQDG
jgi:glutamine phosphoribosylpyrophosphate amidotransferase